MKRIGILIALHLVSGCVAIPDPGYVRAVPEIHGRVTRSGVPVHGVTVYYHRIVPDGECVPSRDKAISDAQGNFQIEGREVFRFWVVLGDPINSWGVCLSGPGYSGGGWKGEGLGYPPETATFECELDAKSTVSGKGEGICVREEA